jgi:hexosaminidase
MRKLIFYFLACLVFSNGYSQSTIDREISIIPQPVSVSLQTGYFILSPGKTVISADKNSSDVASFLSQLLHEYYGFPIGPKSGSASVSSINTKTNILLSINKKPDASIGAEGYRLTVNAQQIVLSANQSKGLFYGVQTLMQLLPPKSNPNAQTKNSQIKIPAVDITDYPRFGYRGMMLDVSRHFFSKDFILRYIDEMAKYKFNVFHWHLTDDH